MTRQNRKAPQISKTKRWNKRNSPLHVRTIQSPGYQNLQTHLTEWLGSFTSILSVPQFMRSTRVAKAHSNYGSPQSVKMCLGDPCACCVSCLGANHCFKLSNLPSITFYLWSGHLLLMSSNRVHFQTEDCPLAAFQIKDHALQSRRHGHPSSEVPKLHSTHIQLANAIMTRTAFL